MSDINEYDHEKTVYATDPEVSPRGEEGIDGPKYQDKQWLYEQYHVMKKPESQIADECGVHHSTINRWISNHNIEKRDWGEILSIAHRPDAPWRKKKWLEKEYVELEKTTEEIADAYNTNHYVICSWLEKHNIEKRHRWSDEYYTENYHDPGWLKNEYVHKKKTLVDIAEAECVSTSTISRWLKKHGIETRDATEEMVKSWGKKISIPKTTRSQEKLENQEGSIESNVGMRSYTGPATGLDATQSFISERRKHKTWIPYRNENWLRKKYEEEGLSGPQIAEFCGVSDRTIYRWMDKFNIQRGLNHPAH